MARQSRWWRMRDLFPRTTAFWIQSRRAPHHARLRTRAFFESPSLWTTSVLAGMLAIVLTLLLFLVGPPPKVALETAGRAESATEESLPAPRLALSVQQGAFPVWWDEREQHLVESRPELMPTPVHLALAGTDWTPTSFLRTASGSNDPAPVTGQLVLPTADDPPLIDSSDRPPASPLVASVAHLGVDVEKVRLNEGDQLQEYALIVRNRSAAAVERVVVREAVPEIGRLVAVEPRACVSREGDLLWQVGPMEPGEELEFTVSYLPAETDSFETHAVADMQSRIGVVTLVTDASDPEPLADAPAPTANAPETALPEPVLPAGLAGDPAPVEPADAVTPANVEESLPPLDEPLREVFPFAISEPEPAVVSSEPPTEAVLPSISADELPAAWPPNDRPEPAEPRPRPLVESVPAQPLLRVSSTSPEVVVRGEVVTTIFEISNDGTGAAENVTLTVHLTDELLHRHGADVKHRIDRLEPGETRHARLLTRARETGTATLDAVLTHGGGDADSELSHIRVTTAAETETADDEPPAARGEILR